ncbi:hypothetical protein C8F04DRAFT_1131289 [Mycena alexandri]|uniref:Uncharacterized protein n=1 Tax=Mycena alexandri TaxID=1745969 RepID=A0AAD6WT94_9AGAR|nr:hypothetical protein C8F04DRAFT_1131289 [Mycena alexandri]
MPLLSNSTGFQVHGGNFYEVHGDINIHQVQADRLRIQNHEGGSPDVSTHGPRSGVLQTWPWRDSYSEGHPNPPSASTHQSLKFSTFPAQSSQPEAPEGGTYFNAESINHVHRHGILGIHILHRAVALEAMHDSAESFPQPRCHPETRSEILEDLWRWHILRVRMFAGFTLSGQKE